MVWISACVQLEKIFCKSAVMSLLESPSFETISSAIKSTTHPDGSYVLALTSLGNYYVSSASAPSNAIHLFDKSSLKCVQTLNGHQNATTTLRTIRSIGGSDRHTLLSAGKDGCVIAWDERSGAPATQSMFFILQCWTFTFDNSRVLLVTSDDFWGISFCFVL